MLAAYADALDLMSAVTGELITTCGTSAGQSLSAIGLSACGEFAILAQRERIVVVEVASGSIVWQRDTKATHIVPLDGGREWMFMLQPQTSSVREGQVAIWRWPFGAEAHRTLTIPHSYQLDVQGDRIAIDAIRSISVRSLHDGHRIFDVAGGSAEPRWLYDGSLLVSRKDALELYDAQGARILDAKAISLWPQGLAFSPVRDDALLPYLGEGLLLVENFRDYLRAHPALPVPFERRARKSATYPGVAIEIGEPAKRLPLSGQTSDELIADLAAFKRFAWKPHVTTEYGPAIGSKFGGTPWLSKQEEWPRCGECGRLMDLWLQLNSADLPPECAELFDGVLQVFACEAEEYWDGPCQSGWPFSTASFVRVCRPDGPSRFEQLPDPDLFEECRVVGWTKHEELPDTQELEVLGIELSSDQEKILGEDCAPFSTCQVDKLMGWPAWQQRPRRFACPTCNIEMREIFQLDSSSCVPILDCGGRGWVIQCPVHRDIVAFYWTF
jgi:Domain of unknown function (DUF1963)